MSTGIESRLLAGVAVLALSACASGPKPEQEYVNAKTAVNRAEVNGAEANEKAAEHLALARAGIEDAEKLMEEEENEAAQRKLVAAELDAKLALSLAETEEARTEAKLLQNKAQTLRSGEAQAQSAAK